MIGHSEFTIERISQEYKSIIMNLNRTVSIKENSASGVDLAPGTKGVSIMRGKSQVVRSYLCVFLLPLVAATLAYAGPAVIGMVAGSTNASVGGETILSNTTLFSGDSLQVNDGVAVVALGGTSRMIFGSNTVASFRRDSDEVTVLLRQGDVSLFHAENTMLVRVKVDDVSVVPISGFRTLGEVAVGNGVVMVTAKDGRLRVESNGQAINVAKGETITMSAKASAPQSAGGSRGLKPALLPPQSAANPSSIQILEAAPSGGALSIPPIGLAQDGKAEADASRTAPNASEAASSAPARAAAEADAIGYALNTRADSTPEVSPHKPPKPPKPH
jgi:hypothetical protein